MINKIYILVINNLCFILKLPVCNIELKYNECYILALNFTYIYIYNNSHILYVMPFIK